MRAADDLGLRRQLLGVPPLIWFGAWHVRATVARGDNLQIAARTGLADKTVRNALSKLYTTLNVEGRPQAVAKARDLGFG